MGILIKSPSSEKAVISSMRARTSASVWPNRTPLMMIFSVPVMSGWKPAPSSSRGVFLPLTSMLPFVGRATPKSSERSVLFPAPFLPITPRHSPFLTEKLTPFSAQKRSLLFFKNFGALTINSLNPGLSRRMEKLFHKFSALITTTPRLAFYQIF